MCEEMRESAFASSIPSICDQTPEPLTDHMTNPRPPSETKYPHWPWLLLALGLFWTAAIRLPLILHATDHIDSDLAVDGLTLLDATQGHWRWHYPGTPHMGILPVLLSLPQAMIWGAGPISLVSGGTVAWLLVVLATFLLAWRAFGPSVACWSIVPIVFSSVGTIWLSGRITGGHLLTLFWHVSAFLGLAICLSRGGNLANAAARALVWFWLVSGYDVRFHHGRPSPFGGSIVVG